MSSQWRYVSRGLLLILIGGIFLLLNMGLLPATFWWNALSWWPLVLIIPGIALLFGRRIPFSLTVAVLLAAALALSLTGRGFALGAFWATPGPERTFTNHTGPAAGATSAEVHVQTGGVRLSLEGADVDMLDATLGYRNQEPEVRSSLVGSQYQVSIRQPDQHLAIWPGMRSSSWAPAWNLQVTDRIPVDLRAEAGAVSGVLDLSRLKLHSLTLKAGAGDLRVNFGKVATPVPVSIDVAASHLVLAVPEGVPVRVTSKQVVGSFNGSGLGLQGGGAVQSTPDFDSSQPGLDIRINGAVSDLTLQRY